MVYCSPIKMSYFGAKIVTFSLEFIQLNKIKQNLARWRLSFWFPILRLLSDFVAMKVLKFPISLKQQFVKSCQSSNNEAIFGLDWQF